MQDDVIFLNSSVTAKGFCQIIMARGFYLTNVYLFKVNNRNTKKGVERRQ